MTCAATTRGRTWRSSSSGTNKNRKGNRCGGSFFVYPAGKGGAQKRAGTAERFLPASEEAGRICDAGSVGSCGSGGTSRCRTGRRRKGRACITVKLIPAQAGHAQAGKAALTKLSGRGHIEKAVRVSHLRTFPFLECDSMVCDFPSFPKKNGKSPKEENAAPSLRPENFAGHYPPRNSLALLAQTSAPADATGEIFSLRAPASVQRGGELHQCRACIGHEVQASFSTRTFRIHRCGPT